MCKIVSKLICSYRKLEKGAILVNRQFVSGCGLLFFLYMLLVVSDVFGRSILNKPIPGVIAIGENVLAFGIFLGWAYTLVCNRHIRVTVVAERFSPNLQRKLDLFSSFCGFLLMFLISYQSLPFALASFQLGETALDYGIPRYYGKFAYFIGSSMFCFQFLLRFVGGLFTQYNQDVHGSIESYD